MFKSLKFVLKDSRTCLCLMRHRPIKKVRKNPAILILGIVVNFVVAYLFYYTLKVFWITPNFAPLFH
jgi:ACR3 family arsenite efflux pump ArsB